MRKCSGCKKTKSDDQFRDYPQRPSGKDNYCRECRRERNRRYYHDHHKAQIARAKTYRDSNRELVNLRNRERHHKNPELFRERSRKTNAELRRRVFDHYGWKCKCCGEAQPEFLTIDHINGGGSKHIREVGSFYRWLIKNSFPEGFQSLCYNCNCAKGKIGICPHQNR